MSIGSVAVDVVPNATGFWRDFVAKTKPGAEQAGRQIGEPLAKGVGAQGDKAGDEFSRKMRARMDAALKALPKAKVDADTSAADRRLQELRANLERLTDKRVQANLSDDAALATLHRFEFELDKVAKSSPDVRVRVNTGTASAELAKLRAELGLVQAGAKKANFANVGFIQTVLALSPAMIPLAGAAAVAGVAMVGLGAAGVTAILGIKREMDQGTAAGQKFSAGLGTLKADFHGLESTAARSFLPGFSASVAEINKNMPGLNRDMRFFGAELGDITKHGISGVLGEWKQLDPEVRRVTSSVDSLAIRFDTWANGPGGAKFAHDLAHDVQQAVPALQQAGTAVAHIFQAASAAGGGELSAITELFRLFNSIPLPILRAAVPAIGAVTIATKLLSKEAVASSAAVSTMVGTFGKLGTLGLVAAGIGLLTSALGEMNDASGKDHGLAKNLSKDFQDVTGSSNAAAGAVLNWAESGKTQYSNVGGIVHQATSDVVKLGVSQTDLNKGILGNNTTYNRLIATLKAKGFTDKAELGVLADLHAAYGDNSAAVNGLSDAEQGLIDRLHITVQTATQYAAMVGVTATGTKEWAAAVNTVATAENTATQTGSAFLAALQQFSTTAGTASDRAALIGATLKAANGDLLSYQGAVAGAYGANHQLVQAFQSQSDKIATLRDQLRKGHLDSAQLTVTQHKLQQQLSGTAFAAINLKTGMIDVTKAGAGPLIQGLQGVQDAAMQAAQATYQHQLATEGGKRAADDAYKVYVNLTRGQLIDEANQLGLTKGQVTKLADAYFGMPKDVKTKIEQEGANPVIDVLNKIGQQLSFLTGHPWVTKHDANTATAQSKVQSLQARINAIRQNRVPNVDANSNAARAEIARLQAQIDALHDQTVTIRVNQINKIIPVGAGANSPGGGYYGANGGMLDFYANGALINSVKAYADGAHVAQIAPPGTWRVWAEPETGGEAYIPLATSKRQRSQAIMSEVASRFGDTYRTSQSYANGGMNAPSAKAADSRLHVTVGLTTDSQGNLQAYVQNVVRDEAEFSGMTARMGSS